MANVWISWIANFDDTDTVDGELRTKKAVKRFKLGILWEAWQFNLCKGIVNCDQLKLPASFHCFTKADKWRVDKAGLIGENAYNLQRVWAVSSLTSI